MSQLSIDPAKQGIMDTIALNGAEQASAALSKWFGKPVNIKTGGFRAIPLEDMSEVMCSAEEVLVAIHTGIDGSLDGHVLLAFPEAVAFELCDSLMMQPAGTTDSLGEMETSAIMETGNIVSSAFVNSLSQSLGVRALPSAPNFLYDMAGAIVEPLVIEQAASSNTALMIQATFYLDNTQLDWWLAVMPDPKTLKVMEALLT